MKVNFGNNIVVIEDIAGIDHKDYPDYVDAYIHSAYYEHSGEELTDEELDQLNENSDLVYQCVIDWIY